MAPTAGDRFNTEGMWKESPPSFAEVLADTEANAALVLAVRSTIADLPEVQRSVVTLRDLEGLSISEVASLLELSEANTRVVLHRARARIREILERDERRLLVAFLVKDINCREAVGLIGDYLESKLPRRKRRRLQAHLALCDACSAYLEQMRVSIAVTGTVGLADLSPEALDALLEVSDNLRRERADESADVGQRSKPGARRRSVRCDPTRRPPRRSSGPCPRS